MEDVNAGQQISRREFVEGTAVSMLGLAAAGVLANVATASEATSAAASSAAASSGTAASSNSAASYSASSSSAPATSAASTTVDPRYTIDLTEIYADGAALDAELTRVEDELIPALLKAAAQVADENSLLAYLELYDETDKALQDAYEYCLLRRALNSEDAVAQAGFSRGPAISDQVEPAISIVEDYLATCDESQWQEYLNSSDLALWHRYLQRTYNLRDHMTTSAEETLLAGAKTARSNVADLFATLDSSDSYLLTTKDPDGNEVTVDGNVYSLSQYSSDRDFRERAYTTYFESLARVQDIFASTLNTYARLSEDIASAYHYDAALDLEMDVRDLDTGVFDTLVAGTREHLDVLATGNELRASILGVDELMPWDRIAPLANTPTTIYSYEEAQSIMLAAFAPLGDDYIAKLQEAFDSRWIDVYPADGKSTVATSYFMMSDHPYLGMSYTGDIYSLFTMAYQLGCFMFDLYALQSPKSYYSLSFLPLSTDATSYVNQLLLADYLIEHAQTDGDKVYHLTSKIELLESSFFRPVMMAAFEKQARDIVVGGGTLTADALNGIWNDLYTEFYPGITIPDGNRVGWTFVSSYYSDFRVQDYAFVIAAAYKVAGDCESGDSEAVANYLEFLAAGNSVPVDELYDLIGIDLSSKDYIADLADMYAALVAEVKELL